MRNTRTLILLAAATALLAAPALAADVVYEANGLNAAPDSETGMHTAFKGERFQSAIVERNGLSAPELHLEGIDNVVVLDGDATLVYGGDMADSHMIAEGEFRGAALTGDTKTIELHKNDLVQIPAGTPQWLKPHGRFRYLVFRVPGRKD
jgi:mannose-6-phosphate isomerase-like protein (cupin superfamily)